MNKRKRLLLATGPIMLVLALFIATGFDSITLGDQREAPSGKGKGLVSVVSAHSVDETTQRLQDMLSADGFRIPLVIDHRANAASVGKELRPNKLIIFGNPNVGTGLMQNRPTVGIDLPLKFLVWEDADGTVRITYNDPGYIGRRHKIKGLNDTLDNISSALNNFATAAAH